MEAWHSAGAAIQWGVFDSIGRALADSALFIPTDGINISFNALEFHKETKVSSFPIERGSFASFNKVEMPATPIVTLAMSGTNEDRILFLAEIDAACKSTELYTILTPEVTYLDYAIERYNYQRKSENGASMLVIELYLQEVRSVTARFATVTPKAQDVGAIPQVKGGSVQGKSVLQETANAIFSALGKKAK